MKKKTRKIEKSDYQNVYQEWLKINNVYLPYIIGCVFQFVAIPAKSAEADRNRPYAFIQDIIDVIAIAMSPKFKQTSALFDVRISFNPMVLFICLPIINK